MVLVSGEKITGFASASKYPGGWRPQTDLLEENQYLELVFEENTGMKPSALSIIHAGRMVAMGDWLLGLRGSTKLFAFDHFAIGVYFSIHW